MLTRRKEPAMLSTTKAPGAVSGSPPRPSAACAWHGRCCEPPAQRAAWRGSASGRRTVFRLILTPLLATVYLSRGSV